ncbi:MAG: hypothetical protein ACXW1Z_19460 [Methylobacter sp.]
MNEVVIWLVKMQPFLSRSTWRQYRSAMIFYFEEYALDNASTSTDLQSALELLRRTDSSQCNKQALHTSAKKKKKISEVEIEKLARYYLDNRSIRHGKATLAWLLSGVWTGLRPREWESAELVINSSGGSELQVSELRVMNAKTTNGRSHGETRTLCLSNMSVVELETIRLHLANVASALGKNEMNSLESKGFKKFYRNCRDCLYQANRKLWPQRAKFISLYSARHQFSADAKKNGLSRTAIAALMGHASEETAGVHYGRGVSGRGGLKVSAHKTDIARVQKLNANRSYKSYKKHRVDLGHPSC